MLKTLILIFAASGIACACPADSNAAEQPPHSMHDMHGAHTDNATPDCCDDCDSTTAMHRESLPVVFDLRILDDNLENVPAWLPVAIDTEWPSRPPDESLPAGADNDPPLQSPVKFHDRMLD